MGALVGGLVGQISLSPALCVPNKRVTLIVVGFFTTEATFKSRHFRREELFLMEKTRMFLATVADGQAAAPWAEGKQNCKHSP